MVLSLSQSDQTQTDKTSSQRAGHTLAGDGLGVGLLAFLTGTAGDQFVEGD